MANSEERLQEILANLEQCRAALAKNGRPETAKLVSLAVLDLRIDLTHTSEAELKDLSDAMALEGLAARSNDPNSPGGPRRCAMLTLVK